MNVQYHDHKLSAQHHTFAEKDLLYFDKLQLKYIYIFFVDKSSDAWFQFQV